MKETSESFAAAFSAGQTQIVYRWLPADLETPLSAYLKIADGEEYSFLLESIEGGENLGRYSIIGLDPDLVWTCTDGRAHIEGTEIAASPDPLGSLRAVIGASTIDAMPPDMPPMAASGLFGSLGYDMVRLVEDLPDTNPADADMPDATLIRPRILVIFDNVKNMMVLIAPVYDHAGNAGSSANSAFEKAQKHLDKVQERINSPLPRQKVLTDLATPLEPQSNMSETEYCKAVETAIDYIYKGDIFQVVPGQRFTVDFDLPPVNLYRSLRRLNPSPFMFLLDFKDFALVGSSPEVLVRVRDSIVTIRPIAGTRARGKTPQEDDDLQQELLADPKERAEHLMLLDLGRNDVGRVSAFGSVRVTEQFTIELYSHVMHIVSNVEGRLREDLDVVDALFAGFPAGTVSGAPKVRAMQIIDELEATRRGYYGGGVGYLSGNGLMDTCIALRTALIKDQKMIVQAGGGVVADSSPESEYQESVNKARALIKAAEMAIEEARG